MTVNGREYRIQVEPRKLLVDSIREDLGLTGTHVGCEHGVCGACTVLWEGEPVRSCLIFAVQADGARIKTVEGMAPSETELHPIQEAFVQHGALQCGYCTPGFIMTAKALLDRRSSLTEEEVREELGGNICRCTGYVSIVEAILALSSGEVAAKSAHGGRHG